MKRMMGCRVGVQGEMWSEARGGSRAAQSRVKSGVQSARCSSGGMLGGVQGGSAGWDVQGGMWRVGCGVKGRVRGGV